MITSPVDPLETLQKRFSGSYRDSLKIVRGNDQEWRDNKAGNLPVISPPHWKEEL